MMVLGQGAVRMNHCFPLLLLFISKALRAFGGRYQSLAFCYEEIGSLDVRDLNAAEQYS